MASTMAAGVACWPAAPAAQSVMGPNSRSLFAKGLAKGCTSAHLHAIFSNFGVVTDCQIARHRSGRSAGFCIITFLRHEEAVAAMQAVDNLMFMGRRLSVKWFSPERALEGAAGGADVLNLQALNAALQLSAQMQPADLMAHLAQMLESQRLPPQQVQNHHVAAWLDNYMLAQHQESPLALQQQQQPAALNLLNLSALSINDFPNSTMAPPAPCGGLGTHPATPTSADIPDGAVFVSTTTTNLLTASDKVAASDKLGHSRLAKWCAAPGSNATGHSSIAHSYADDVGSETASVHASDDSSTATTTIQLSGDGPRSCGEGVSPGAVQPESATATAPSTSEAEEALRNRALAAAAAVAASGLPGSCRTGGGSDPGYLRAPGIFMAGPPTLPGGPALAPVRTAAPHHLPRPGASQASYRPTAGYGGGQYGSCGGSATAAGATDAASLHQAFRLQQALAEQQARSVSMNAQAQYVDALTKLAAARDQVMAAASLQQQQQMMMQHQHMMQQQPMTAPAQMAGHRYQQQQHQQQMMNPFMQTPQQPQQHQGVAGVPDLNALFLLQNAAAMGRPMY